MLSGTTRKLPDSALEAAPDRDPRTRPRLQTKPLDFTIQLPPSQPPAPTEQTMFVYIHPSQPSPNHQQQPPPVTKTQDPDPATELTMCFYVQPPPPQPNNHHNNPNKQPARDQPHAPRRNRKKPTHAPREGKPLTIPPPYKWATDRRAKVHTLKHLTTEQHVETITGDVECKRCQKQYQMEYNLEQKCREISDYVQMNMYEFRDRAPHEWMNPTLPNCRFCDEENCVKPVVGKKKKLINWLFLFLGRMLGCCTLEQLKYFCKHTGNHRTGAKDRVLFLTYLELCKQVDPDRWSL